MINYELAKKLKGAGYPQNEGNLAEFKDGVWLAYPSLEALIDACGESFQLVERTCVHKNDQQEWQAIAVKEITPKRREDEQIIGIGYGDTPSEAVANLYIALQK